MTSYALDLRSPQNQSRTHVHPESLVQVGLGTRLRPLEYVHARVQWLFALLTILSIVILVTMGVRIVSSATLQYVDVGWMCLFAVATVTLTFAEISCLRSIRTSVGPQLESLVLRDELTGLYNRRYMTDRLDKEISLCRRYGRRFSLFYLDLDGFKQVNDRFGHDAGDKVLREVGGWLRANVRGEDIPARLGGDEFVVLLPDTGPSDAANLVIRLDARFRSESFRVPTGEAAESLSFSVGVAAFPGDGETNSDILSAADKCMFEHKTSKK